MSSPCTEFDLFAFVLNLKHNISLMLFLCNFNLLLIFLSLFDLNGIDENDC